MLRIAFAGTPEFAARALAALAEAGQEIALVLTQPDRPAGRGRALQASAVKQLAQSLGLPVWQPPTLRDPEAQKSLEAAGVDLMVVAAYGLILPAPVLAIPRLGCINIHASLLPRWRGAAPIQRAIEAGDSETGITIMQMDAGLDTGPMLSTVRTPIGPQDTGGSLHDRLAALGAEAIVAALAEIEAGTTRAVEQPEEGVTYARKLDRTDALLDFAAPGEVLVNKIRAFDPVPGAVATLDRKEAVPVKIWRAVRAQAALPESTIPTAESRVPGTSAHALAPGAPAPGTEPGTLSRALVPGTILRADAAGLLIGCADGAILAQELQKPGGRRLPAEAFLRGFPISAGERFLGPETT